MKNIFFIIMQARNKAFSLLEIMMALVVVSIMLAVMAPVFTAKTPSKNPEINVIDTTPVGVIVAWYGTNYPKGWIPVNGQSISEPEYSELRNALNGIDTLPDLNGNKEDSNNSMFWIIKVNRR